MDERPPPGAENPASDESKPDAPATTTPPAGEGAGAPAPLYGSFLGEPAGDVAAAAWRRVRRALRLDVVAAEWRRRRGAVGLVAVAVLACAAVVAVGRGAGDDSPGVRVVETGFSRPPGPFDDDVSYGVVIENTADQVAYHTVACVELQQDTDTGGDEDCEAEFTVEVLLPGQQVGFGAARQPYAGDDGEVRGISVDLEGPATWEAPEDYEDVRIVADDLAVAWSPEDHPVISFDRRLLTGRDVTVRNAAAYAVLRDRDGDIVGAAGMDLEQPVRPRERLRHSIVHDAPLPGVATAEVYVFPSGL